MFHKSGRLDESRKRNRKKIQIVCNPFLVQYSTSTNMQHRKDLGEISTIYLPETMTTKIVWSIPNIFVRSTREMKRVEQFVTSQRFSLQDHLWRLAVIENSYKNPGDYGRDYLGFFICMINCNPPFPEYDVKLGLKNSRGYASDITGKLDSEGQFGNWNFLRIEYINHSDNNISSRGFLNFFCEIQQIEKIPELLIPNYDWGPCPAPSVFDIENKAEDYDWEPCPEASVVDIEKKDEPGAEGFNRLLQDFKKLLLDGQNSDMILKVENREFSVHKGILSVRSPVFSSMLEHDMTEKRTGVVDIPDCTAESFEVFLLYLYTGFADTMSKENVFNLYYAADKYKVDDLKKECIEFMMNTLSVDTFCDVITLALRHGESELQKVATRFFRENMRKIVKTVQWQAYIQEYPIQANELYIKALNI